MAAVTVAVLCDWLTDSSSLVHWEEVVSLAVAAVIGVYSPCLKTASALPQQSFPLRDVSPAHRSCTSMEHFYLPAPPAQHQLSPQALIHVLPSLCTVNSQPSIDISDMISTHSPDIRLDSPSRPTNLARCTCRGRRSLQYQTSTCHQ